MGIDPRILNMSYSSNLDLHACPRMFELNRKNAKVTREETLEESLTFQFGHLIGNAIQRAFEGATFDQVIWESFISYKPELYARDDKRGKSFFEALVAIEVFYNLRDAGFLDEWELVYYEGRPACELSFCVIFPNGFRYRGFVDAVLRNKNTGQIMVLECKTTGAKFVNPAMYKNSAQAVGYSVVLDKLFPDLSAYEVLYMVYLTGSRKYELLPFGKSYLQRAQWIQEIILDCKSIEMYEEIGVYPMRGESCFRFNKECKYLQNCQMSTVFLIEPESEEDIKKREEKEASYQIVVTVEDLIQAQMNKD